MHDSPFKVKTACSKKKKQLYLTFIGRSSCQSGAFANRNKTNRENKKLNITPIDMATR